MEIIADSDAVIHGGDVSTQKALDSIKRAVKPGVAICSCNDGLRPVIFKLEATDEIAEIDYIPVR